MRVVLQMLVVQFSFSSFIRSAVVALLLIVCVTGTPPGPAGMNDGHVCNQEITRQGLGGDGEAGEAGDAAGSGKGWLWPSLSSFSGRCGPSSAFLGMALGDAVV